MKEGFKKKIAQLSRSRRKGRVFNIESSDESVWVGDVIEEKKV